MVNDLPLSWVTSTLEAEATRVGFAKHADPSRLYVPKNKGGLALPSISSLYQKQRASVACLALTSKDPTVRHTATLEIKREEQLSRAKFQPMIMARNSWQADPNANKRTLTRRTKAAIMEEDTERRLRHARGLEHQGQLLRATDDKAAEIWTSAALQLPPLVLKFCMNAAQDTLPHNSNLACGRGMMASHQLASCMEKDKLCYMSSTTAPQP